MSDSPSASQRPTLLHLPPDIADYAIGDIAVEFAAEACGLHLYDWQAWCLRNILARRTDGNWAARDSGLEVPRQNGKNSILEALELYLVFLGGAQLVVHSAHEQPTAEMHFARLRSLIESSDELADEMPKTQNGGFHTANGKERIELADGRRIVFKTRTKKAGRGPSPDAIIFDEAMELDPRAMGALTPSLSARKKAMLVFTSSSPRRDSAELHRLRDRAKSGDGGRLFYAAWNSEPDVDPANESNWFRCNPSLEMGDDDRPGKQIEAMRADRDTLTAEEYAIEHLGIPEVSKKDEVHHGPIDPDRWASLARVNVEYDRATVSLACVVAYDRSWTTIVAVGTSSDGFDQAKVVAMKPGTTWAPERLAELSAELGGVSVAMVKDEPLVDAVTLLGVAVVSMSGADQARSSQKLIDACSGDAPTLRHRGEPALTKALEVAVTKPYGDGNTDFSSRLSSGDISPLKALTLAYGRLGATAEVHDPANNVW